MTSRLPERTSEASAGAAARPLLLVVSSEDRLAETAVSRSAFERAGDPKELVMIEGHHFIAYQGKGFAQSSEAARKFLVRHLAG